VFAPGIGRHTYRYAKELSMDHELPSEDEALEDVLTDEYEARLDELGKELPALEREGANQTKHRQRRL
jgi:hypothetical protein